MWKHYFAYEVLYKCILRVKFSFFRANYLTERNEFGMKKLLYARIVALILLAILLVFSTAMPTLAIAPDSVRLQDDFYTAVNADWLNSTVLSPDRATISGFCELSRLVYARLLADFSAMCPTETTSTLGQFLAYWAIADDMDTRNAQGAEPIVPVIARITELQDISQLCAELDQWILDGLPLPFSLSIASDLGNAGYYALYFDGPSLFLPDVSYYSDPLGATLLDVFAGIGIALLEMASVSDPELVMENALAFDRKLVPYGKTAAETSAYAALYNPIDMETFAGFGGALDFERLVQSLLNRQPDSVIVRNPAYLTVLPALLSEARFEQLRDWMLVRTVFDLAGFLGQAFSDAAQTYSNQITGQSGQRDPRDLAFLLATEVFGSVIGQYYGQTYFGDAARAEVSAMADDLKEAFRKRLQENDWLSAETISAALEKLDVLTVHIGYPDQIEPIYERFVVTSPDDGGSLLSNTLAFARMAREESFARFGTEVDPFTWTMSAHTVNAQYNPLANTITFPAAILQAPFYCPDQSMSANLGGIGAVIAHEIIHAFDLNGAQFGADGSLSDWWTETDYAAFSEKARTMIELFDGVSHGDSVVCGILTVSENIADAGGLATALDVLQSLPDADPEAFFRNWATIWRSVSTPEYTALLLTLDVHAPGRLRTNLQLGNLDAFYTSFGVTPEDDMYIAPERRVTIW